MPANLNEVTVPGGIISALETITTENALPAITADSGKLVGVWVNVDTDISADTDLTIFVNGSTATVTVTVPDTQLADTSAFYTLSAELNVTAGDMVTCQTDGAQVAATVANVAFTFRR